MAWLHPVRLTAAAAITTREAARRKKDSSVLCRVVIAMLHWLVAGGYRRDVGDDTGDGQVDD
jgi:hypothetical protein